MLKVEAEVTPIQITLDKAVLRCYVTREIYSVIKAENILI